VEEGTSRARIDLEVDPDVRFIPLRRELGVTSFGMNAIVFAPGQRGRIHRHENQEEVYIVLEGAMTLLVEEEELTLDEGEAIRIAPALRRQIVNKGSGPLRYLALGGAGEHQGRDGEAFADWDQSAGEPPQEVALPADLPPG
jgi:mannose-6-phosphate isomerase-like protein (cupin superfamily)